MHHVKERITNYLKSFSDNTRREICNITMGRINSEFSHYLIQQEIMNVLARDVLIFICVMAEVWKEQL